MANDVPKDIPDEVQRWTAKRRVALVLTILKGETTVVEAARKHAELTRGPATFRAALEAGSEAFPQATRSSPSGIRMSRPTGRARSGGTRKIS